MAQRLARHLVHRTNFEGWTKFAGWHVPKQLVADLQSLIMSLSGRSNCHPPLIIPSDIPPPPSLSETIFCFTIGDQVLLVIFSTFSAWRG